MGFDRSKVGVTTSAALKKQETELAIKRPTSGKTDYLQIKDGENKFRILPFHSDGGGSTFSEARTVSYLELKVEKRDEDGDVIEGKFEIKGKPVFNSKVHGNTEEDLVEYYMHLAQTKAIPEYIGDNKGMFKQIWDKIVGVYKQGAKTQEQGLKPQDSHVVYAMKSNGVDDQGNEIWGKIGLLELKKSQKDGLTEKAAEYGEPDPFTDIDNGVAVIITKNPEAKKSTDWYKVKLNTKRVGNTLEYVASPLSDEMLNEWAKLTPLHKKYANVFTQATLDLQIEGLKRFEEKLQKEFSGFSVFQYPEFGDMAEKIYSLVPEPPKKDEEGTEQEEEKPVQKSVAQKPSLAKALPANGNGKPMVKRTVAPVVDEQPDPVTENEEEEEEEVVEEIKPRLTVSRPVINKEVKQQQPAAHIAEVDSKLSDIRAKLKAGKK